MRTIQMLPSHRDLEETAIYFHLHLSPVSIDFTTPGVWAGTGSR